MELFILDSLFRRNEVVDQFDSLIWTERYATNGDFELVIASTPGTRNLLTQGQLLGLNRSDRVMTIDSVEDKDDSDGRSLLTVKGPSIEYITEDRSARPPDSYLALDPNDPSSTEKKWIMKDSAGNVARALFKAIAVDGIYDANDKLPFITSRASYTPDSNPEPTVVVSLIIGITSSLKSNIEDICQKFGLGYRIVHPVDKPYMYFDIYTGNNRTSNQTTFPAVIFSSDLGNVNDTTYLTTSTGYKNVAYVISPKGKRTVYAPGYASTVSGLDRHVIYVDASDITLAAGTALDAALEDRGQQELAKYQPLQGMDGEITQDTGYLYNVDYGLGDLVEMRNPDGVTTLMQVTEQIFASDEGGEKEYPTLTNSLFITPGSWYSGLGNHYWNDAQGTWSNPT